MGTICPSCRSAIPAEDINVATDLALCRACGKTYRFSEIAGGAEQQVPELGSPPRGIWYEKRPNGFLLGATNRSPIAILLVLFTFVWSGFSLSLTYGMQSAPGLSFIGLPFLMGTCVLLAGCALTLAGKTMLTRDGDRLSVFTGVGRLGLTRNYAWSDFRSAREDFIRSSSSLTSNYTANARGRTLALEGNRRITFGAMWTNDRRNFVLNALRSELGAGSFSQWSSSATPLTR
jgi:hypothetical protein